MTHRIRLLSIGASAVAVGSGVSLILLTVLDHLLGTPTVDRFDSIVQSAIHHLTNPSLTRLMLAFTYLGAINIFAPALATAVLWLAYRRRSREAALLGWGMVGAFILNETLKLHFHRFRPQVRWSIGDEHTYSFPSGHSLFAVVLYGTLAYLALRPSGQERHRLDVLLPAILMPLTIGLSRIYLGMHYPTDVLAGWVAGVIWLGAITTIDRTLVTQVRGGDET